MKNNPVKSSVNDQIYDCLNLDTPKSFFLFAGAGSGKTRSLVEVLTKFKKNNINRLRKKGQRVGVITYTNAACDEIKSRLEFDPTFHVSTIHSFAWYLIKPYTYDIRNFIIESLKTDIADLNEKQNKANNTATKTYVDRARKIESKNKRLNELPQIKKFTYNPNGENIGRDSLNHAEVIKIAAEFINKFSLIQNILVQKFPILLIDESQDTKKELVDAFFTAQENEFNSFTLGMFGDTMQRIYTDGKPDLDQNIPNSWSKPAKTINYRCPKRVVELINNIRTETTGQKQVANKDEDGFVRLFIVNANQSIDKASVENQIAEQMVKITNDEEWLSSVKILTLEHHMAAKRGGFSAFFDPLYAVDKLKTGLLDGSLSGVSLFSKQILPTFLAKKSGDEFTVARVVKKYSPILKKDVFKASKQPIENIQAAQEAVSELYSLWDYDTDPTLSDILKTVYQKNLFRVPDNLIPIAKRLNNDEQFTDDDKNAEKDMVIDGWETALQCSFSQFEDYVKYISDESRFGTHQGIKGLEFPRVMVILDDEEARGFLFSYEKLFGAVQPTQKDIDNQTIGKETSIDRTRRLFYVTCSRAEKSLAIVAYTKNPAKVKNYAQSKKWFNEYEVITQ